MVLSNIDSNKNNILVETDSVSIIKNEALSKTRLETETLGDYLKIGKNLDTIAKNYTELKSGSKFFHGLCKELNFSEIR